MFQSNEDRIVKALESIAESQMKMTQIAEQSFKEAKELRDITMGMMKKDLEAGARIDKAIDERIFLNNEELLKSKDKKFKDNLAACEDNSNENPDEDDEEMFF